MILIAADIGSYSIKFLISKQDKNHYIHKSWHEVPLKNYFKVRETVQEETESEQESTENEERDAEKKAIKEAMEKSEAELLYEEQMSVLQEFLEQIDFDYRLIIMLPHQYFTTRFLSIPIKNKAKAKLVVPFKIEEHLPYTLSEAHMAQSLKVNGNQTEALIQLIKKEEMASKFQLFNEHHITPQIATTQTSVNYTLLQTDPHYSHESFCLIDIGHQTTKAWFFYQGKMIACHTSYIAGSYLSYIIAQKYQMDVDDVNIYKHQNAFVLTPDQFDDVDEDQKEFSIMMENAFRPLLNEFRRWSLGYRVLTGSSIAKTYITGGTANIKNILKFWAYHTQTPTHHFNYYQQVNLDQVDQDKVMLKKFQNVSNLVTSYSYKRELVSLLTGHFSLSQSLNFPLGPVSQIFTRSLVVSLLLSLFLLGEYFLNSSELEKVTRKVTGIIKNPTLALSQSDKRMVIAAPERLVTKLNKEAKSIQQEVSLIESSYSINALYVLESVRADLAKLQTINISEFKAFDSGNFSIKITGSSEEDLNKAKQVFDMMTLDDYFVDLNKKTKVLNVSGAMVQ